VSHHLNLNEPLERVVVPNTFRYRRHGQIFLPKDSHIVSDSEIDINDRWLNAFFSKTGSVWRDFVRTVRGTLAGNCWSICCASLTC
jgi:hypothetical protein